MRGDISISRFSGQALFVAAVLEFADDNGIPISPTSLLWGFDVLDSCKLAWNKAQTLVTDANNPKNL